VSVGEIGHLEPASAKPARIDPFGAPPGAVPFSDFLQAENLRRPEVAAEPARVRPIDRFERAEAPRAEPSQDLYPDLGDVEIPPPQPRARFDTSATYQPTEVRDVFRQHGPSGRLLDVVI